MKAEPLSSPTRKAKLLDQVVNTCKKKHYARKTAETYRAWARDYLLFHRRRGGCFVHARDLGGPDVESYLTYLAVERRVAAATQNQALNAVVFLYKQVLGIDLGEFSATRAKRSRNVPTVLTQSEVKSLLAQMRPPTPVWDPLYLSQNRFWPCRHALNVGPCVTDSSELMVIY